MPEAPLPGPSSPNSGFLFGDPKAASQKARVGNAMGVSLAIHAGIFALALVVATQVTEIVNSDDKKMDLSGIIWTATEGPGGGGGGGGNKSPEPPRKAELPGKDKVTVPVDKPKAAPVQIQKELPKPEQNLTIPAVTTQAGAVELPGTLTGLPSSVSTSQGTGTGGGAGTGTGSGIGPGQGSGLGDGYGGGTGGGAFRPGNGVMPPKLLFEKKPSYTPDAMRAKIQGVVTLEAIVGPDGSVGNVRIIRSLDPTFGLDQEAIRTVKQWRFAPGTRLGQPVPVIVEIEMTFTLR